MAEAEYAGEAVWAQGVSRGWGFLAKRREQLYGKPVSKFRFNRRADDTFARPEVTFEWTAAMQRGSVGVCIYVDKLACEIFSTYISDHIRENLKWLENLEARDLPSRPRATIARKCKFFK